MYASPKAILSELAGRGSSATRMEALRLLALPDIPEQWPECQRRSRLSLLRRLVCNRKKSASARLQALREVLTMAAIISKPNDAPATTPSPDAAEMLRVVGKNHLREVSGEEWSRYAAQHTVSETLCAEFWNWHLPDPRLLELISGREGARAQIEYWETVRRRSAGRQVHAHAVNQIKMLEKQAEGCGRLADATLVVEQGDLSASRHVCLRF